MKSALYRVDCARHTSTTNVMFVLNRDFDTDDENLVVKRRVREKTHEVVKLILLNHFHVRYNRNWCLIILIMLPVRYPPCADQHGFRS